MCDFCDKTEGVSDCEQCKLTLCATCMIYHTCTMETIDE